MRKLIRIPLFLLLCCAAWLASADTLPKVVASINPIANLAAGVMAGTGNQATRLVAPSQSPHHYQLKPSDMKHVSQADLFIWIGPDMEHFLGHISENVHENNQLVLSRLPGLHIIQQGHESDPHIWLSPANARIIVMAISDKLSLLDPANATQYRKNAVRINHRLTLQAYQHQKQLKAAQSQHYLVVHDGFGYFTEYFQLEAATPITRHHGQPISAKQLQALGETITDKNIRAAYSEPQSPAQVLNAIISQYDLYHGVLDPIGANQIPNIDAYFQTLDDLAMQFRIGLTN